MLQAFSYLDGDGDGYITLDDLRSCGPKIRLYSSELQEMLSEADKDGDGMISKEEFVAVMKQTNLFNNY